MAKVKTKFVCNECGYETAKWMGKCPSCGSWNSFIEEVEQADTHVSKAALPTVTELKDIKAISDSRTKTGIEEFDRVLGGGIVRGSAVLAGGEPGIGKSTLFLQAANALSHIGKVLYISGEESGEQVKLRADRLGADGKIYFAAETRLDAILAAADAEKPDYMIVDSIQTIYDPDLSSAPGSVSQVRSCASSLVMRAKKSGIAVFIIGHVTKDGSIAGPRVLEHLVDTVLYFEGERQGSFRILRAVKNRFGSTDEIGVFEMRDNGMREVDNPSLAFIEERGSAVAGTAMHCAIEGTRPVLMDVEALVTTTSYGVPRRLSTGVDYNRVSLIVAVLEKKIGLKLYNQDIYVNAAGGLRMLEPASDLAVAASIVSAFRGKPIPPHTVLLGEIGLTGDVRRISQVEKRVAECARLGIERVILPAICAKEIKANIEVIGIRNLGDVFEKIF